MMDKDKFRDNVYGRFEEYKVKKEKRRKNILKYGTISFSALFIAVAIASPIVTRSIADTKNASLTEESASAMNVNKSDNSGGEGYGSETKIDDRSVHTQTEVVESTQMSTMSETVATMTTTTAWFTEQTTTAAMTQASSSTSTIYETDGPAVSSTGSTAVSQTVAYEKYSDAPYFSINGKDNIVGFCVFSDSYDEEKYCEEELSGGAGVKYYSYSSGNGTKSHIAIITNGALVIEKISDDGGVLKYTMRLTDTKPMPPRTVSVFAIETDLPILFEIYDPLKTES